MRYLSIYIVHNMRQSPTQVTLAGSCVSNIKLFLVALKQYYFSVLYFLSHIFPITLHFQLPCIDIYNSLLLLSFYWNNAHKMV